MILYISKHVIGASEKLKKSKQTDKLTKKFIDTKDRLLSLWFSKSKKRAAFAKEKRFENEMISPEDKLWTLHICDIFEINAKVEEKDKESKD